MGTHPIFESDFDCLTGFRMSRNNPPDILAAQAKLLEVAQRQTNEEIQKKLEMLGKQVAAAQAQANAQALRTAQTNSRKQQVQNQPKSRNSRTLSALLMSSAKTSGRHTLAAKAHKNV